MKLSKYYCSWCEGARLEFREVMYDAPNGPCARSLQGIVLGCSMAQITNCPDATGACDSEEEAEMYASERCKTRDTSKTAQPSRYTANLEFWREHQKQAAAQQTQGGGNASE